VQGIPLHISMKRGVSNTNRLGLWVADAVGLYTGFCHGSYNGQIEYNS